MTSPATAGLTDPVARLEELFEVQGASEYLGEAVTQAAHMLQAARLAELEGADDALIAAALLHDVGHFTGAVSGHELMAGTDNRHSDTGAEWLAQWFGPEVTEPVRLHVAAKRYLCATEPDYFGKLSAASVHSLGKQGGPMSAAETAAFAALPHAQAATRLRRWDDGGKLEGLRVPDFPHYRERIARLLSA